MDAIDEALNELLLEAGVLDKPVAHVAGPQRERAVVTDPTAGAFKELHKDLGILYQEIRRLQDMVERLTVPQWNRSESMQEAMQRAYEERARLLEARHLYGQPTVSQPIFRNISGV